MFNYFIWLIFFFNIYKLVKMYLKINNFEVDFQVALHNIHVVNESFYLFISFDVQTPL